MEGWGTLIKRLGIIALALASLTVLLTTTSTADARAERTYRITFENTTDGQYFTPINFVAHGRDRIFGYGREATPGIQAVAENGLPPVLAAEWTDAGLDNTVIGGGPIIHGASVSGEFTTSERRYSVVSMIICTNDGFGGVNSRRLPARMGETVSDVVRSPASAAMATLATTSTSVASLAGSPTSASADHVNRTFGSPQVS